MNSQNLLVPLKNPHPDFITFRDIVVTRTKPTDYRVRFAELFTDHLHMQYITETLMGKQWHERVPLSRDDKILKEKKTAYLNDLINFWYRMGYDYIRFAGGLDFPQRTREGIDPTTHQQRGWAEEGQGMITSWPEFETYPWPGLDSIDYWQYEYVANHLPEGMGLMVCPSSGVFEVIINHLVGYTSLAYLLYDQPDLVTALFEKVGTLIYGFYQRILGLPNLTGFFQGEDMGHKTGTLISPTELRKHVLPWHKKYGDLAHQHGLVYWIHACGNLEPIMDDLLTEVKIDAKHSFEDEIIPVTEFKKKYGDRVGVLGGIDVDKLTRLPEPELRAYVRDVLDKCMPGGGYALGSGNSVASYVPVHNYLVMLDEGLRWTR